MKLKNKLPEFIIKQGHCINKNNYTSDTKYSSYGIFCQKLNRHPLKVNMTEEKMTLIPVQTDRKSPESRFISGTPTGGPGVHKIRNDETIQVLGPTLVYNIKNNEHLEIVETFIKESDTNVPLNSENHVMKFDFDSHLQNNKKTEVHIFEFNTLLEKHAQNNIKVNKQDEIAHVIDTSLKLSQNVVHKHVELLYNKQYEDHIQIKTAALLTETAQDFFSNPGDKYLTKNIKRMGEEQEKILNLTLKSHRFKDDIEYQKYYELKKSAIKIKNLVDKDSDFD